MPKKYIETVGANGFRKKPIGSGPWKFARSVSGDRIEYEAVDSSALARHPAVQTPDPAAVPEQSTRLAMVRTGEAAIASIGPDVAKGSARSRPEARRTYQGPCRRSTSSGGIYRPEVKGSPLIDVRVREALSLAIDRQQIIEHVMEGGRLPLPFTVPVQRSI